MNNKIDKILKNVFKISENKIQKLDYKKDDIWDSLKHMELITIIEKEFKIKLTSKDITSMVNYSKIKKIISKKNKT